jgi:uncharacterized membrane protein
MATNKKQLDIIESDIKALKAKILRREPKHFSYKAFVRAFFGALLVGLTFVFKGSLVDISVTLQPGHLIAIVLSTLLILLMEIYFIAYRKVTNKKERPLFQFMIKRLLTFYAISLLLSVFLVYVFGINTTIGTQEGVYKLIIVLSMPTAIGASLGDLLKKY